MILNEVSSKHFKRAIDSSYSKYLDSDFSNLNNYKVDKIHNLLFEEKEISLGIIIGVKDLQLKSPFSAPYGGFCINEKHSNLSINLIDRAIRLLKDWAKDSSYFSINIVLPPEIINRNFISNQVNSFYRNKFSLNNIYLNHFFILENFNGRYAESLPRSARRNLKIAIKSNLEFIKCEEMQSKKEVFNIIKLNRTKKNRPISMSFNEIIQTSKLIIIDFFIVKNNVGQTTCAAIIFRPSRYLAQVQFWGDNFKYTKYKPMNFLAFKIFEYYKKLNFKIVDLGVSTEDSTPNIGLCYFKESIGCELTNKFNFKLNL